MWTNKRFSRHDIKIMLIFKFVHGVNKSVIYKRTHEVLYNVYSGTESDKIMSITGNINTWHRPGISSNFVQYDVFRAQISAFLS